MESTLDIKIHPCYYVWKVNFPFGSETDMKNHLEEFRKKSGMTQEMLADRLEVSRQTIGALENGRYNPSILLAFKIARFFNVTIEDLFLYEEDMSNEIHKV